MLEAFLVYELASRVNNGIYSKVYRDGRGGWRNLRNALMAPSRA